MKKAFTLIELLTVIAISAVMLTLIVLPVFQSFNVLRTAQAFADAQDKARLLVERIGREAANAVSVRNIGDTVAQVPISNSPGAAVTDVTLPFTRMDLLLPAEGDPSKKIGGAYVDPISGKGDPTLQRPKGDVRLPVAPGMVFTRWFVGLNNPAALYNEPYTGILMPRNGNRDNLYVLRRAEVQQFVYRARKDGAASSLAWRPNLNFFKSDDKVSNTAEFDTRIIDLDDAKFFVRDGLYQGNPDPTNGSIPGKNDRVDNWAKASVIQTEISRYDMIRPSVSGSPPQPDSNALTRVVPLVQFRPTRVSSAPAAPSMAARPGESVDGLDRIGPDTYRTERGLWANAIVRYYPAGYTPGGLMEIASVNATGGVTISAGGSSGNGLDGIRDAPNNFSLFDLALYEQMLSRGDVYPFTAAAHSADQFDLNSNPGPPGRLWTPEGEQRRTFTPFRVLTATGQIVTSFPIEEVGTNPMPNVAGQSPNRPNLPLVNVVRAESPTQAAVNDATLANAPLSPTVGAYDPNRAYNRLFNAYPELQGVLHRFIDLRWVPNEDGTLSPLSPQVADGKITGFSFSNAAGGVTNRVRIVPGSDEVYAPDQTTTNGTYGAVVRYTRTTSANPGPNQYRLVYADLAEPTNGGAVDYSQLALSSTTDFTAGFSPTSYSGTNVMSAVIQPRFKAGYLQFCSDPNVPLPLGRITVRYRFQFNGPGDTFAVDHDTREVMQILLTIKNYPQASVPNAQTVTLKSTATLRNALR